MKKHFRILSFCICLCLLASLMAPSVRAYTPKYSNQAQILSACGLLAGDGSGDFKLNRSFTRAEMSVMLVRLLRRVPEAESVTFTHPFDDVRTLTPWADNYVGYLYQNGLISGKSSTVYGAKDPTTFNQYVAVVLRVLGYSEAAGDFAYNSADLMAQKINLLSQQDIDSIFMNGSFLRDHMVLITYNALTVHPKNDGRLLYQKLGLSSEYFKEGLRTEVPLRANNPAAPELPQYTQGSGIPLSEEAIVSSTGPSVFMLQLFDAEDKPTFYISGVNLTSSGIAVTCCSMLKNAYRAQAIISEGMVCNVTAVLGCDENNLLDVIKLDTNNVNLRTANLALSPKVKEGDKVYGIGYDTHSKKITESTISSLDGVLYHSSVKRCFGYLGGALTDNCGLVIGIFTTTEKYSSLSGPGIQQSLNVGYAVSIDKYSQIQQGEGVPLSLFMKN